MSTSKERVGDWLSRVNPTTTAMERIFSGEATLEKWLRVEAALAKAEAALELIPREAAEEIQRRATVDQMPFDAMEEKLKVTGHPIVSMVWALASICEKGYGEFVHWGATTQDIMDTTMSMQMKEANEIILSQFESVLEALLKLAVRYKGAVMAGRTHGQQATPTTFGFRAVTWAAEVARNIERLKESMKRAHVGNLTGAVGNYVAIGPKGPEVEELVMKELGLGKELVCWHSARDSRAEYAHVLAQIASILGKMAYEISNYQRPEIGELEEPIPPGSVGSSTMPHKRNPSNCEYLYSTSSYVRKLSLAVMDNCLTGHERDGFSMADIDQITEMCQIVGYMLYTALFVLSDLVVKTERMEQNLWLQKGLIFSEALMMDLAKLGLGRQTAHDRVYDACMTAFKENRPLKDVLLEDPVITKYATPEDIDKIMDAKLYTSYLPDLVEDIVKNIKKRLQ